MSAYCHDAAWTESALLFGCVYSVRRSKDQLLVIAPILNYFDFFSPRQTLCFLFLNPKRRDCEGSRFRRIFPVGNIEAV